MAKRYKNFIKNVNEYLADCNAFKEESQGCVKVDSFNSKGITFIDDTTKIIIVGTLTPQSVSRETGYYYMSQYPGQIQYKIIDEIRKTNLVEQKKNNNVPRIQEILHKEGIGLLDVVEQAYVVKGSSNDDDIFPLELADKYFKAIKNPQEKLIICNTKNAYNCFISIVKRNDLHFKNIVMCTQRLRQKGGLISRVNEWAPYIK